ncbi:hypothetical protein Ciccas_001638 [Cichlidogyrus casuarinus]|uniref:Cation-transporting P-type ATPase C-terminal domain-containing protein n=1 Tax=Cichlidogyrus casuarinus TaxID=1844966 RepID=A0ABD2QK05_9PLAT
MLWVNLLMDTLASLALATENPTLELLNRAPYGRTRPLIDMRMLKHILGQAFYQLLVLFVLIWHGPMIFGMDSALEKGKDPSKPTVHFTLVFNTFVLMTLCNEFNARKIHNERNVFSGLINSPLFVIIMLFTLASQVLIIEYGGVALSTKRMGLELWLWSTFFGLGTMLWHQVLLTLPPFSCLPTDTSHKRPADTTLSHESHHNVESPISDGSQKVHTPGKASSSPLMDDSIPVSFLLSFSIPSSAKFQVQSIYCFYYNSSQSRINPFPVSQ